MKDVRTKYLFLCGIILLFILKIDVKAIDSSCTQAEQLRLRELVNAAQLNYEFYEEDNGEGVFQGYRVSISNFKPDFYVFDEEQGTFFGYNGSDVVTQGYFIGGITYKFPFYAAAGTPCAGQKIMTKNLQLVPYNPYSEDPLCVGYETYELCKKFTPIKISSYQEFEQRMKQYIKSLEDKKVEEPDEEKPSEEKSVFQFILDFIIDNYVALLVVVGLMLVIMVGVIVVRRRRSIL